LVALAAQGLTAEVVLAALAAQGVAAPAAQSESALAGQGLAAPTDHGVVAPAAQSMAVGGIRNQAFRTLKIKECFSRSDSGAKGPTAKSQEPFSSFRSRFSAGTLRR
jgi:hypothetical protein